MLANRLRLAQGLLRCGQTPFSSFLIWLSAGDWLLPGWWTGGESSSSFRPKFGGHSHSHSLGLRFGVSLREVVFKLVGRPLGKTAASIPRGATQTPGYVKELKLVWFGNFRILFGSDILAYPVRLSSKYYVIHRWSDVGIGKRGEAVCFQLFGFVFLFVNLWWVRLYVSVMLRAVDLNNWRS